MARPANCWRSVSPGYELVGEIPLALVLADVEQRGEVGMREGGRRRRIRQEAFAAGRLVEKAARQHLQRNRPADLRIACPEHLAEGALAHPVEDPIMRDRDVHAWLCRAIIPTWCAEALRAETTRVRRSA